MNADIATGYLREVSGNPSFSRADLLEAMQAHGMHVNIAGFKAILQRLLDTGRIARAGRNAYFVLPDGLSDYVYEYAEGTESIAESIEQGFPEMEFSIFELRQLNEFVNHQIAHNTVFVHVPAEAMDFVFDAMREEYPGKFLLNPSIGDYHQYWCPDMIVMKRLISESPLGRRTRWHSRIEKVLVDLMADHVLQGIVSPAELPGIYEDAFHKYVIDESCLFRYAKRRNAAQKIRRFIQDETDIVLRLEKNDSQIQFCRRAYPCLATEEPP